MTTHTIIHKTFSAAGNLASVERFERNYFDSLVFGGYDLNEYWKKDAWGPEDFIDGVVAAIEAAGESVEVHTLVHESSEWRRDSDYCLGLITERQWKAVPGAKITVHRGK